MTNLKVQNQTLWMLNQLDSNKNGVSYDELQTLKSFDINEDNKLSRSEAKATGMDIKDRKAINDLINTPFQDTLTISAAGTSKNVLEFPGKKEDLFANPVSMGIGDPEDPLLVDISDPNLLPENIQDISIEEAVALLDSPDKVAALLDDIPYNSDRADNHTGTNAAQSPEETFDTYSGVCRDMHQLGAYIMKQHGYDAVQLGYASVRTGHAFLAYQKDGKGYGAIEYGRNYSPEVIAEYLGRPATSPEEALLALRPGAVSIRRYSEATLDELSHSESIFYTQTFHNIMNNLRPRFEDSVTYSNSKGLEVQTHNGRWGASLGYMDKAVGDPTGKESFHASAGYWMGNEENWMSLSAGLQYRPHMGRSSVGPNSWKEKSTIFAGAAIDGQLTPIKKRIGNHQASTIVGTSLAGNVAFNKANVKEIDPETGEEVNKKNPETGENIKSWQVDPNLSSALHLSRLDLTQRFEGQLSPHWSYRSEAFMHNNLSLAGYAYYQGGQDIYANIGVNGSLHYDSDVVSAFVGGQYLFKQVDNLDSTTVGGGVSIHQGRVNFTNTIHYIDSLVLLNHFWLKRVTVPCYELL